ncbi:MAG: hypothetical protein C0402_10140 [Thermodesulfovibrio sp.]|nr:hypothetical protein [Thermodesulfovibrio sp.]
MVSTNHKRNLMYILSSLTILLSLFFCGLAFADYPCDWGTPGGHEVIDGSCGGDIGAPSRDSRYWGIATVGESRYEIHWGTGCYTYSDCQPTDNCDAYGNPQCALEHEPPSGWVSEYAAQCTDCCIFWSKKSTWICPGTNITHPVYGGPPTASASGGAPSGGAGGCGNACCGSPSGGGAAGSGAGTPGGGNGGVFGIGGSAGGGNSAQPAGGGSASGRGNSSASVSSTAGASVNLATGHFIYSRQILSVPGVIPINASMSYSAGTANLGAFGMSTYFEYDWWLQSAQNSMLLIKPGNYQYSFFRYSGGTYKNTVDPAIGGAVATLNADNSKTLKMDDGSIYTFDQDGRLIQISDGKGNQLSIERRPSSEGGYLKKITNQEGRFVTFNQTWTGNFYRTDLITDSSGRTVGYGYETDPLSIYPRLKTVSNPDGSSIQYNYDSAGRMSEVINEKGVREVLNEYDSDSRVIRQTHADGGVVTFSYTFGAGGIPQTSMTAPNGATTTWSFNNSFYITAVTNPDGTTSYEREPVTNRLLSVTDALGRITAYTYDAKGRLLTKTDSIGNTTAYEYEDVFNKITKITDAMGNITRMTYDINGNLFSQISPDNKTTTFTYHSLGKPLTVTDAAGNITTMEYDLMGNLTRMTDPLGNSSVMTCDSLGRLITSTDAKGNSTANTYDAMGSLLTTTDQLGHVTSYNYDLSGKLSQVTDAKGQIIRYEYDNRNRLVKMTDQLGNIETYVYDTSDNLVSMIDRKGQVTAYTHDLMNRVTRIDYADGSYTTYLYDATGKILLITDSVSGTIAYTYTGTGCGGGCTMVPDKVASETTPIGSVSYTYDAIGRRTGMTVAGQPAVSYGYDTGGRLNGMDTVINGASAHFGIVYDSLGRRSATTYPNGATTNYSYDNGSHLLNLQHKDPASQVLESLSYTYDQTGDRTSMDRQGVSLPKPGEVASTAHDAANRMLTFNSQNIVYDLNGNMTSSANTCGTTTYSWDVRNRLTGISGYRPDCTSLTASFRYDALGRRIEKAINGRTIPYLYDGEDILQAIENGVPTVSYIRTLNIDEPLARVELAINVVRYYHADALGSIIGLSNESGQMVTSYAYDAFGQVAPSGEMSDNPFQYTGRENDGTGLYFYRARYYSPELQRFISEDPIGLIGGTNLYVYVENNPTNRNDPLGLAPQTPMEWLKEINDWRKRGMACYECRNVERFMGTVRSRGQGIANRCSQCCSAVSKLYPYMAQNNMYTSCLGVFCAPK